MSLQNFVEFKKKRTIYEAQVEEKNKEDGVQISETTYKNSIDRILLSTLWHAGFITSASIEVITENDIKACIEDKCVIPDENIVMSTVEAAVKDVRIKTKVQTVRSRIWTFVLDYRRALENAGYAELVTKRPHVAIKHILYRLKPSILKDKVTELLEFKRNEGLHKKNFFEFVKVVVEQADILEKAEVLIHAEPEKDFLLGKRSTTPGDHTKSNKRSKPNDTKIDAGGESRKDEKGNGKNKPENEIPLCLFWECKQNGERHYIKECTKATESQKVECLKKHKNFLKRLREKKAWETRKAMGFGKTENQNVGHSTLFPAAFCRSAVETTVLADGGGDDNLLPSSLLQRITKVDSTVSIITLTCPETFRQIGSGTQPLTCARKVELDVELRIRHGSKLLLRKVARKVAEEEIEYVILGRPLLEAPGINTRDLLKQVSYKFSGVINTDSLLKSAEEKTSEGGPKTVASVMNATQMDIYHSQGIDEEDHLEEMDIYIDLGHDPEEDLDEALMNMVQEAKGNGLSANGCQKLESLLLSFRKIFKIRLGMSDPADVAPMKLELKKDARPVRVKGRRYSVDERAWMELYVKKLVEMGFLIPNPRATWQAAPILVPKKNSKSKYRLAIDLRPFNAATIKQAWPMPHLDSEIYDFAGSECFAVLDFVSGYWQLPVDPDSWDACDIVTRKGTYSSTRALPGLTNATTHFQSTIEPLVKNLRNNLKAWLDDFNLHAGNEKDLLDILEKFFRICQDHNLYLSAHNCHLFTKEVTWCGRKVSGNGYEMDPSRIDWLKELTMPETAENCVNMYTVAVGWQWLSRHSTFESHHWWIF